MATNPFDQFDAPAAPAPTMQGPQIGAPIMTFPEKPKDAPSGYQWGPTGTLAPIPGGPADKPAGSDAPSGYRWGPDGTTLEPIPGGPASGGGKMGRAMRQGDADKLETQINALAYLEDSVAKFTDDFAGNTLTGELENWAQGKIGTGTPGQRDWWANFRTADNSIRNALFGASLTEGEKEAYEATTVDPSMTPEEVKRNLKRRVEVAQDILRRRVARLHSVYNKEEVEAALGEYRDQLLGDAPPEDPGGPTGTREQGGATEVPEELLIAARNAGRITPELEEAAQKARPLGEVLTGWGYNEDGTPYPTYGPPKEARGEQVGGVVQTVDSAMRGVADVLTIGLADEIAAAGDTLFGGGTMAENLARQRAIDEYDTENNFAPRLAGQVAGGLLLPAGRAKGALQTGGVGAAYGGAYGFGSANGDISDRLAGGVTGATIGGLTGAGLGAIANKLGKARTQPPGAPPSATGREIFEAGERIGVTPMPADVGGPTTKLLSAATAATPGGTRPMSSGAARVVDEAQAARDRVAQMFGTAQDAEQAGEAATQGALKFRTSSRDQVGRMYERARAGTENVRIEPKQAYEALDANIAELSTIPGASDQVAALQALRAEMEKIGPLTVDGIRGMRTAMRTRFMKEGLVGSDLERRVNQVIESASEDLANGLADEGLTEAAAMLRQADSAHRVRMQTMEDVIMPIIGKKGQFSGEQVMRNLQTATQGNNARFTKFMNSLPESDRNTVSASIIAALGRPNVGEQGAAEAGFSLGKFLTDWNKLGPTARKALLSPQARAQLDDLAKIAEGTKASQKLLNRSNTGLVGTTLGTGMLAMDSLATMGAGLAGQYVVGRLLSSPSVTKALVKLSRAKTPGARATIIGDLGKIASRQPEIANDVLGLQDHLLRALSASPGRAAASEQENNARVEPVQ